jgi:hypothetical protein
MAARELIDDGEYRKWVALNPAGFVLNTAADPVAGSAVLHLARCPHIADHKTGKLAGGIARKFVAETKQEMKRLATDLGRPPGRRWNSCNTCGA